MRAGLWCSVVRSVKAWLDQLVEYACKDFVSCPQMPVVSAANDERWRRFVSWLPDEMEICCIRSFDGRGGKLGKNVEVNPARKVPSSPTHESSLYGRWPLQAVVYMARCSQLCENHGVVLRTLHFF